MNYAPVPIVMVFAGHDPCGGAGIQADIETLTSLGCHPCTIITALTAQDTSTVKDFIPADATFLVEQARAVLEDMPVAAFKIGMTASVEIIEAIHTLLQDYPEVPVVFDPVMAAGGGGTLARENLIDAFHDLLMPCTSVVTPNTLEAKALCSDADSLDACAQQLMAQGTEYVLITGGHEGSPNIVNRLWGHRQFLEEYQQKRLPGEFHGTGCTLASSIAGYLAHGASMASAVRDAQAYTAKAVAHARRLGMGQLIPDRLSWSANCR
ncbi:bifunctional hydroxymethylpyrimidine kinase/phosphomethylpyrimidine kinase [Ketobacter alkanivorans]|uniref:hydroxymethylpyrimidine kinase n=1 Tax=Ketobacter alkanivorans TaxID=1917421 RepID=A0A2K9LNG7_9GAMM|nr:bifunctional hydroxymethylpyrimidine kinase/phosphomethylpyrimidine kinase [Ketobacter alkanivorans]AUM13919.1 bifunctional hydroxymethylpyrimidine kinase/phosphomethylpyrimidine kinase [Ketobacter alkanivorans]MCP5017940.1 bifunctional hydroxymethylpyrimidine kinase/phosphomethylpyrimidine kinase [Ketobacter sp.]